MATQAEDSALKGVEYQGGDFASLLNKEFKPKSDEAKSAVESAVLTLAQQALSQTQLIGSDVVASIEAMIAELDGKLSAQINQIMHHADFQQIESAWRGLHHLVNNTETDESLKIRVMNISKAELGKTLKRYKGTAWDQSPIFKRVYEEEFGQFGEQLHVLRAVVEVVVADQATERLAAELAEFFFVDPLEDRTLVPGRALVALECLAQLRLGDVHHADLQ